MIITILNEILNLIMIMYVIAYVIDHSGIIIDLSKKIHKLTFKTTWDGKLISLKPFTCAKCLTFWVTLLYSYYVIYNGDINYLINSLFIASMCSLFVKLISISISFVKLKIIGLNKYII